MSEEGTAVTSQAEWEADLFSPDPMEPPEAVEADPGEAPDIEADASTAETDEAPDTEFESAEEEGEVTDEESAPVEPDADASSDEDATSGDVPELTKFSFKADGTEIQLESAFETPDGWLMMRKEDVQKNLQPFLADRGVWRRKEQDYLTKISEAESVQSEKEIEAQVFLDTISGLMDQGPEALWAWLENIETEKGRLTEKAEHAVLKAREQRRTERESNEAVTKAAERVREWAPGAIRGQVEDILKSETYKGLPLDADDIYARLTALGPQMVFRATEDIPHWGVRKGNWAVRLDIVQKMVEGDAALARRLLTKKNEADKAETANSRRLGRKPPPVVGGDGGGAAPVKAEKKPTNREEWEASLRSND